MLKLRLKRVGRKQFPTFRLVIMESRTRRDGRAIDEVGSYNSINKKFVLNQKKILKWLEYGVKPTRTVRYLLKKSEIL